MTKSSTSPTSGHTAPGTIKGVTSRNWLWVEWADGPFDSYDPQTLELASKWEHDNLLTA